MPASWPAAQSETSLCKTGLNESSTFAIDSRHSHLGCQSCVGVRGSHRPGYVGPRTSSLDQGKRCGTGSRDGTAQCSRGERRALRSNKTREQCRSGGLRDSIVDCSAEESVVAAGQCRYHGSNLSGLVQCHCARNLYRENRPRLGSPELLVGPCQHDIEVRRHRELDEVERIEGSDEHDATEEGRSNVVGMAAGHLLFGTETSRNQRRAIERFTQQRVDRNCPSYRGSRASPLAT
jgi:hypothetical protein